VRDVHVLRASEASNKRSCFPTGLVIACVAIIALYTYVIVS
jgi:hypothetical protein